MWSLSSNLRSGDNNNMNDKINVYNDHPRDLKFVVVVDRWSLFIDNSMLLRLKLGHQNGGRWSLFGGGR